MSKQNLFNMVKAVMQNDTQKASNALSAYLNQKSKELLPKVTEEKVADFEFNNHLLNSLKKKREGMHPADQNHKDISKQISHLERRLGRIAVKRDAPVEE